VPEPSGLYYPNRIARYLFLAMEDVMGQSGLNMLLSLAKQDEFIGHYPSDNLVKGFDFASMAAIQQALEDIYGSRGGRGMAMRIGRACFSNGLKSFGALAGMSDPAFRALPREERCRMGVQALAAVFNKFTDQRSSFEEDERAFRFIVADSPMAWGRRTDKPVCHALAGMLQEGVRWASNGYEYIVYETACHACGDDHCVFTINKTPIGLQR
jgi:predicted hydrocarbon binding protein